MEYRTLGRTGLTVSLLGQGCGGPSVLGAHYGWGEARRGAVVRQALELGITVFDTSQAYGDSQELLGRWLPRTPEIVISTKTFASLSPAELAAGFGASLAALQRDSVDILLFHDLTLETYDHAVRELVPMMRAWQAEGRLRAIGFSQPSPDQEHTVAWRALQDAGLWDVMLITYSVFSQAARFGLFARLQEAGIGVLTMFAVRKALHSYAALAEDLAARTDMGARNLPTVDAVQELLDGCGCDSLPEAVYRFVAFTPGVSVVLSGSTEREHMRANAAALDRGPLPPAVDAQLVEWFRDVRLDFAR
jgi:aryl-alcohol dehydrogenase-like predicted oxidoreductase